MKMRLNKFSSVIAIAALATSILAADEIKSMLPAFGPEGADFTTNAKDGNKITGWAPTQWTDNSEWAAVSATYTKLSDPPKEGLTGVGIKITKVDEGQMQFTSWTKPTFKKDMKYVVEGWIRSKENSGIKIGIRQPGEPYEFFAEQDLSTTAEWKQFSFPFSFTEDKDAFVMFTKADAGAVDLAGITVHEQK
jgi:hypothetical protein